MGESSRVLTLLLKNKLAYAKYEHQVQSDVNFVALGGLVVMVFAIGTKVRRLKPGRGRWTFKSNKNPCRKILRHVKHPCGV
jgi:hypothetical protein